MHPTILSIPLKPSQDIPTQMFENRPRLPGSDECDPNSNKGPNRYKTVVEPREESTFVKATNEKAEVELQIENECF